MKRDRAVTAFATVGKEQLKLTYSHAVGMVSRMKTTLNIDESVMAQLKREAARQGRTMSELVETALRLLFRSQKNRASLPPLPSFKSRGHLVEIAVQRAWEFMLALLASPGLSVLVETDRHVAIAEHIFSNIPHLSGNLLHDTHTAVLMQEHGIRRIYTRDTDFHRFPFLEVIDPLQT